MARRTPDPTKALAAVAQATGRGRGRRSPLYLWLKKHHDALAEGFKDTPPAWAELAAYLGGEGVLDIDGKPPTARGTRGAWYRVRRDLEAQAKRKATKPPSPTPAPGEIAPGVRAVAPQPAREPALPSISTPERPPMPTPQFRRQSRAEPPPLPPLRDESRPLMPNPFKKQED